MPRPTQPDIAFLLRRHDADEHGNMGSPGDDDPALHGSLQLNIFGDREMFLRLADKLREFAVEDTSTDSEHHEHLDNIVSVDGKVRLHIILRKDDVGDATWRPLLESPLRHPNTQAQL